MKRHILTGCIFLLAVPLFLTACLQPTPNSSCNYVYDQITDQGRELNVTSKLQNYFGNGGQGTLSAAQSSTITVSADAGITADLGAIVAGVNAQLHLSASYSVTASITNSPTVTVPVGSWLYGDYGVFVEKVSGHLYSTDCQADYGSHVSSSIPIAAGWCTWISGQSPAPCESSSSQLTIPQLHQMYSGHMDWNGGFSWRMSISSLNENQQAGTFTAAGTITSDGDTTSHPCSNYSFTIGNGTTTSTNSISFELNREINPTAFCAPVIFAFRGTVRTDGSLYGIFSQYVSSAPVSSRYVADAGNWDLS